MTTTSEMEELGALLVFEDDRVVAQSVVWALESAGRRCYVSDNVDHAVSVLRSRFDVVDVLLDRGVFGDQLVDGIARLREAAPWVTIIGTSGHDCRDEFLSAGVSAFLYKPWSVSDLLTRSDQGTAGD